MKKIVLAIAILSVLMTELISAEVLITEVLYDPVTSTAEAVELYNIGGQTIDISGWKLATEASLQDATIPDNVSLEPGQHYLVTDPGFAANKDNSSWPDPDYEETIQLYNDNSGVAIINGNITSDAVGWGDAVDIDAGFFEGVPAADCSKGESLQRIYSSSFADSNNNSIDFFCGYPELKNSVLVEEDEEEINNSPEINSTNGITINLEVENSNPVVHEITLDQDDSSEVGIQLMPIAGQTKDIFIQTIVSDENGIDDIDSVEVEIGPITRSLWKQQELNTTSAIYNVSVGLDFFMPAGNYQLFVSAKDRGNTTGLQTEDLEYKSLSAIDVDSQIALSAFAGNEKNQSIEIRNLGNTIVNVELSGTDLENEKGIIPVSSIFYSFDNFLTSTLLSKTAELQSINLQPGENSGKFMDLSIRIPEGSDAGSYSGTIFVNTVD